MTETSKMQLDKAAWYACIKNYKNTKKNLTFLFCGLKFSLLHIKGRKDQHYCWMSPNKGLIRLSSTQLVSLIGFLKDDTLRRKKGKQLCK